MVNQHEGNENLTSGPALPLSAQALAPTLNTLVLFLFFFFFLKLLSFYLFIAMLVLFHVGLNQSYHSYLGNRVDIEQRELTGNNVDF